MKSKKRRAIVRGKQEARTQGKPKGKSKYALKHVAQLKGSFFAESPLPPYRIKTVTVNSKDVNMKVAI